MAFQCAQPIQTQALPITSTMQASRHAPTNFTAFQPPNRTPQTNPLLFRAPAQNSGRRPSPDNRQDDSRFKIDADATRKDLSDGPGGERPQWSLSCYSGGGSTKDTCKNVLTGQIEQSFEEVRFIYYLARYQGNEIGGQQEETGALNAAQEEQQKVVRDLNGAIQYVMAGKNEHPNRWDIVDDSNREAPKGQNVFAKGSRPFNPPSAIPTSGFGQPSAPSTFGQPASTSTFGQPAPTSAFGQPAPTSTFGQPASAPAFGQSAFGRPSQPAQTGTFGQPAALGQNQGSAFGQPSSMGGGGTFGQPSQPGANSGFGKPSPLGGAGAAFGQAGGSGFGQPSSLGGGGAFGKPSALGSAGGFGQPSAMGAGSGVFGKPAAPEFGGPSALRAGKPVFGQATAPTSAFGQASQPTSAFGQPSQPTSAFGQPSQPTSAFGQPSQPTSVFGQSSQPKTAFGQPSQPTSAFGQPNQPASGFGQPSTTTPAFGQPPTASVPAFGTTPTITSGFGSGGPSAFTRNPPAVPFGQSTSPAPAQGVFGKPAVSSSPFVRPTLPNGYGIQVQPSTTAINTKNLNAPPLSVYNGNDTIFEEKYKFVRENGVFDEGIMPEWAPQAEWVGWGSMESKFKL
ncbi:hypothetical protein EJ08DRAFT_347105 [Tothia fuscella]|uniref:Uncharacterized protein n=1 Tax=Tothia fuscella TaxID=1048955 RepID=A0A9P4NMH2_9PEZI|nr:hypothetical protein EJ08DRAFT_347105 [Tothia fuscella]